MTVRANPELLTLNLLNRNLPHSWRMLLQSIAVPVSLTDTLVEYLAGELGWNVPLPSFLEVVHNCGIARSRNGEWGIAPGVRHVLLTELRRNNVQLFYIVHDHIRDLICRPPTSESLTLPSYLHDKTGMAYHTAPHNSREALRYYASTVEPIYSGRQWLASLLAEEQQDMHILPQTALEPAYLRGRCLYAEGDRKGALPYLKRVAETGQFRLEVAIAEHLVGSIFVSWHEPDKAAPWFLRSLRRAEKLPNADRHRAHVLHSLGRLLSESEPEKAEKYLREARRIAGPESFPHVLHSLGRLLIDRNPDEARTLLEESRDLHPNPLDKSQILRSLGLLHLKLDELDPAQEVLKQALDLDETPKGRTIAYRLLADVERKKGNLSLSQHYQKVADDLQPQADPRFKKKRTAHKHAPGTPRKR